MNKTVIISRVKSAISYPPVQNFQPEVLNVSGNIAGQYAVMPKGVILHGTRSGNPNNDVDEEFNGTLNYVRNGANDLGWNATVGDGIIAIHMHPSDWGWHARACSYKYVGIEIAQAVESIDITDKQIETIAWYLRNYVYKYWSNMPHTLVTHSEVDGTADYGGQYDGKTDVFSRGNPKAQELKDAILALI